MGLTEFLIFITLRYYKGRVRDEVQGVRGPPKAARGRDRGHPEGRRDPGLLDIQIDRPTCSPYIFFTQKICRAIMSGDQIGRQEIGVFREGIS